MDQASLLLLNLAFMFDKKSLLKIKKLMRLSVISGLDYWTGLDWTGL